MFSSKHSKKRWRCLVRVVTSQRLERLTSLHPTLTLQKIKIIKQPGLQQFKAVKYNQKNKKKNKKNKTAVMMKTTAGWSEPICRDAASEEITFFREKKEN